MSLVGDDWYEESRTGKREKLGGKELIYSSAVLVVGLMIAMYSAYGSSYLKSNLGLTLRPPSEVYECVKTHELECVCFSTKH